MTAVDGRRGTTSDSEEEKRQTRGWVVVSLVEAEWGGSGSGWTEGGVDHWSAVVFCLSVCPLSCPALSTSPPPPLSPSLSLSLSTFAQSVPGLVVSSSQPSSSLLLSLPSIASVGMCSIAGLLSPVLGGP